MSKTKKIKGKVPLDMPTCFRPVCGCPFMAFDFASQFWVCVHKLNDKCRYRRPLENGTREIPIPDWVEKHNRKLSGEEVENKLQEDGWEIEI